MAKSTIRATPVRTSSAKATEAGRKRGAPAARPTPGIETATIKQQILETALRQFAQLGFDGVAIGEIARLCGISTPLVHYHFSSKLMLWQAAVLLGLQQINRELGDDEDYVDVDEITRLKIFIRKYIGFMVRKPFVFMIVLNEMDATSERFRWIQDNIGAELYAIWMRHVSELRAKGLIRSSAPDYHVAQIVVGACTHFLFSRYRALPLYDADPDDPSLARRHADLVIEFVTSGLLLPPRG